MDLIAWCGGFGSRAYLVAVERAGAATWTGLVRGEGREPGKTAK